MPAVRRLGRGTQFGERCELTVYEDPLREKAEKDCEISKLSDASAVNALLHLFVIL